MSVRSYWNASIYLQDHLISVPEEKYFSLNLSNQILVPLPEAEARHAMFEEFLPSTPDTMEIPYDVLVENTEGYSGSDIRLVCKEAAMQPLRRLMAVLEGRQEEMPEDGMCSILHK
jgi:SpoVK/Ycf46/Vps4 family AAA+-type ATPase